MSNRSISTIKGDAAAKAFAAAGQNIVWAVADSGIDGTHPHFAEHDNLVLSGALKHVDFTSNGKAEEAEKSALVDGYGHGTHVAGIIAGAFRKSGATGKIEAAAWRRSETGAREPEPVKLEAMSGVAPQTKIVSLKVLDDRGKGEASSLIAACEHVQKVNNYGRRFMIHGLNMSIGYDFEPDWFACGQSPLCVEVDRLVKSGVCVVVAAGNTGFGYNQITAGQFRPAGLDLSINDPGNAELAITVGSTHREAPHRYGVSYFSSKGPTGDGRLKPDIVAPGEKILSAKAGVGGVTTSEVGGVVARYDERSGTSMAAPHVSGALAAFLSVRSEFIGKPDVVKRIFLDAATDLRRERTFQGSGLLDLMRALQSV